MAAKPIKSLELHYTMIQFFNNKGYGTEHSHSQKEHMHWALQNPQVWWDLGQYWPRYSQSKTLKNLLRNVRIGGRDGQFVRRPYVFHSKIWSLWMAVSPSSNIGLINTKLEEVVKFGVIFLAMWVLCPISHNTETHTQSPPIWNPAMNLV